MRAEFFTALEKLELDEKRALHHRAAQSRDQISRRGSGTAGGNQVIGDDHARLLRNRIDMDLQRILAVLELLTRALGLVGKLPRLAHDRETRAQFMSQCGADDKAAGLDSKNDIDVLRMIPVAEKADRFFEQAAVRQQGRNVFENDARLGKIPDVSNRTANTLDVSAQCSSSSFLAPDLPARLGNDFELAFLIVFTDEIADHVG